jgi:hypothetical protein
MHVIPREGRNVAFRFDSLRDRHMREAPRDLMASPKAPTDMGYEDLGRFIEAMERSGSDVNTLRVERALKIAVPVTCLIIALFGMPLATSNQRGGAAYGIGLALGTTVVFLIMIQLTKAVGGKGVLSPELARGGWTNDGMPAPPPAVAGAAPDELVTLPMRARGERWATVFETASPGTARLLLDLRGGPDGLLYEVVLDGLRLTPARDAWRPSARDLRLDLGPQWLGQGGHLLEFVARERPAGTAVLHLRALELAWR